MLTAFVHAAVFDGIHDGFINHKTLITEDGHIKAVVDGFDGSEFAGDIVDLTGKFVMPGIINAHTHIVSNTSDPMILTRKNSIPLLTKFGIDNARECLNAGIVLVRDLGCPAEIDLELRDLLNDGSLYGPDAVVSGRPIVMTGGHGYLLGYESDGPDEVRKHTRELLKSGVDVVKFMASGGVVTAGETPHDVQLTVDELRAGIEEAHHKGIKTAAHAQGRQSIVNAIEAGIDSIEHGVYLDEEVIELFLKHDVTLVPTLVAPYFIVESGIAKGVPQYMIDKSKQMMDDHMKSFALAQRAGVKIAMGTDAGTPFNAYKDTYFECVLMCRSGMSEQHALYSATRNAADLLGVSDCYGSFTPGTFADFIVLDENPLADIANLSKVTQVYKRGKQCRICS